MAGTRSGLDRLEVDPKLRDGDIEAFLRLNRRYFVLLDDPEVTGETRLACLVEVARNFKSLDHWLSKGKRWPEAWREVRVDPDPGEQTPESSEEGSPEGCGEGKK